MALRRSTATRVVWFSALTTIARFGTLVISGHRGVASLGDLRNIGRVWVRLANRVSLPSLLALRRSAGGSSRGLVTSLGSGAVRRPTHT